MNTIILLLALATTSATAPVVERAHYEDPKFLYDAALWHYVRGEYAEAVVDFHRAGWLKADPAFAFNIGLCYMKLGLYGLARAEFDETLASMPIDTSMEEKARVVRLRTTADELAEAWEPKGHFGRGFYAPPHVHE
jgi:tetratricopeptide (TPR) repeat protein